MDSPRPPASMPIAGEPLRPEELGRRLLSSGSPELRALVVRRPWRVWADTAGCYAGFALAFALLAMSQSWWAMALAFLVIGNRQYALSILTHEGNHRTLFRHRWANDLFCEILLCAPVGVDFLGEQANHSNHHRRFATEADPDRYLYVVEDKATRLNFLLFLTGLTMFPRAIRKALRGAPPSEVVAPKANFFVRRKYSLLAQAMIFGAICLAFPWWYYPIFWLAPVYPLVFVPHKIRMFCEHAHQVLPDTSVDGSRLITYVPSRLERVLFSPFNLNYHAEHHLWPFVPYYNLPRLHERLVASGRVEIRRSYLAYLVHYVRRLPVTEPAPQLEGTR